MTFVALELQYDVDPACLPGCACGSGGKGILAEEEQLLYNLRLEKEGEARREIAAEREKLEQEARNSQVSVSRRLTWHRYQVHGLPWTAPAAASSSAVFLF